MKLKKNKKICLLIVIILIFFIYFKPFSFESNPLDEFGINGMKLKSFSINGFKLENSFFLGPGSKITNTFSETFFVGNQIVNQHFYIKNNFLLTKQINISLKIEINYPEIRWGGDLYKLNSTKLNLKCYKSTGQKTCPNIFMDEKYDKRINYDEVGQGDGYAIAYEDKGKYFIEFKIDDLILKPKQEYSFKLTYINQTKGFNLGFEERGNARAIARLNESDFYVVDSRDNSYTRFNSKKEPFQFFSLSNCGDVGQSIGITTNGSDIWTVGWEGDFVCHFDTNGNNLSDGFFTSVVGDINPAGITTNGSDFWIHNYEISIAHIGGSKNNMSDGWMRPNDTDSEGYGITTNGSDFWMIDNFDHPNLGGFIHHFSSSGKNLSDGFDVTPYGIGSPTGIEIYESNSGKEFWIVDDIDIYVYYLKFKNLLQI